MADLSGLPPDLRDVIERAISQIDNLSVLIEGEFITPDEWQREMAGIIDQFHQEAVRVGADQAAVPILNDTVQRLIDIQLAFLQNFTSDIQGTDWLPSYNVRAQMYGSAIKQAYWHGDVIRQTGRVLPLPAMPAEGTQCLSHCKCTWRIETINAANGHYDAYWERNVKDSCQTCIEREAQWSPVRIRGGELQL